MENTVCFMFVLTRIKNAIGLRGLHVFKRCIIYKRVGHSNTRQQPSLRLNSRGDPTGHYSLLLANNLFFLFSLEGEQEAIL